MLKIIISKDENMVAQQISKEKKKLGFDTVTQSIESEVAENLAGEISIFGDKEVYEIYAKGGDMENVTQTFFEALERSPHLFFLIGGGAEFEKQIENSGVNKKNIVKLETKVVFDFPSDLVAALQKHDRKNSWALLMRELDKKDAEPVHGTCVFAYKSLLTYLQDPTKNSKESGVKDFSWKQAGTAAKVGKREKKEVIDKYFELVLNYHKARLGEGDLNLQLEKWVLEN